MRIGLDIDGILADFNRSYMALLVELTGEDKFGPDYVPTTWAYPTSVGYTKENETDAWEIIKHSNFWSILDAYPGVDEFLSNLPTNHDYYFITSRPGERAKLDTEDWFMQHGVDLPTVLISSEKGECCHALNIDLYIDDKNENVLDVLDKSPSTDVYMLGRPWNSQQSVNDFLIPRLATLTEFLEAILDDN